MLDLEGGGRSGPSRHLVKLREVQEVREVPERPGFPLGPLARSDLLAPRRQELLEYRVYRPIPELLEDRQDQWGQPVPARRPVRELRSIRKVRWHQARRAGRLIPVIRAFPKDRQVQRVQRAPSAPQHRVRHSRHRPQAFPESHWRRLDQWVLQDL